MRNLRRLKWALTLLIPLLATGCSHDEGPAGPQGPQGPAGPQGPPGSSGAVITIPGNATAASDAAAANWAALSMRVNVTSVTISSPPIINFTVTDDTGVPVKGLGNTSKSSTSTLAGLT